eukprot:c21932_g1_i4 orf=127-1758(+)
MAAFRHPASQIVLPLSICAVVCVVFLIFFQVWVFEKKWQWVSVESESPVDPVRISNGMLFFRWVEEKAQQIDAAALNDTNARALWELKESLHRGLVCLQAGLDSEGIVHSRNPVTACLRKAFLNSDTQLDRISNGKTKRQHEDDSPPKEGMRTEDFRNEMRNLGEKLRQAVHFLEMKDTREQGVVQSKDDRTWFMSSLYGHPENGNPETFSFPSQQSRERLLCVQGRNTRDGTKNSYGFAWKDYLPLNATILPGITLVADNYYDYFNPWHSMTALLSFAAWRRENNCKSPRRLVLYHWGELVTDMGSWISNVLEASLGVRLQPDPLNYQQEIVCFEQAVVHRRGMAGMSLEKLKLVLNMVRCMVRKFCRVEAGRHFQGKLLTMNLTLLVRSGARGFKNESGVVTVIEKVCKNVEGCKFTVAHIANLSFCEQMTNMMFMTTGSSIMEMFPKGWLEYAGNGQYIYKWLADWIGLQHEGTWRDPDGPDCPYPSTEQLRCFFVFKDSQIAHNETYLSAWLSQVLEKLEGRLRIAGDKDIPYSECPCE